jgi:hypothetical protein
MMLGEAASIGASRRPRRWRRRLLALAAVVVAGVVGLAVYAELTNPNPITPSRQMMIGTWRDPSGATLTLNSDGTFLARALPADAGESSYGEVPSQGSGRWRVGSVPAEPAGVIFNFSARVQMELLVERVGSKVIMYFDKGDPDEGTTGQDQFTKIG